MITQTLAATAARLFAGGKRPTFVDRALHSVREAGLYLAGLDQEMRDRRPAWLSVGLCRMAMFSALYLVFVWTWQKPIGDGAFEAWFATKSNGVYHPFGILRLFGSTMPSAEVWWAVRWIAQVSTICAIVGFLTRPMMIVSVITTMLLALLLISESYFWSHNWNVVFLAAIPFALCNAGSSLSVDRMIGRVWPRYPFGRRTEPVLWGVLAAQAAIALFVFAAFWAKIFATVEKAGPLGPWHYVFSDNMRNILGVFWLGTPENLPPPWIEWAWSVPLVWQALILGHLIMQAAPILALVSLQRPGVRLLEGLIFLSGVVALGVVARGWNWAWIPLTAFFVDWDHYFRRGKGRFADRPSAPRWKVAPAGIALLAFFAVYTAGWVTQRANGWGWYPFSNMSFYAGLYVHPPYSEHQAYADYMIGEVTVAAPPGIVPSLAMPSHWTDATGQSWKDFQGTPTLGYRVSGNEVTFPFRGNDIHGIGRETDLDRLYGGLRHVHTVLALRALAPGARLVAWLKTAGFPAYPAPMEKKTLHAGVRGIWEPSTDRFTGLTSTFDFASGRLTIADIRGETGDPRARQVFARFDAHLNSEVQPLVHVPGEWIDDRTFAVAKSFIEQHRGHFFNSIIRTETVLGAVDFDGPMQWF